ncbi:MAG: DUF5688 family protein [Eubacterium sp.]|nr:DUF5688 family protein [Eubacterium sp.]
MENTNERIILEVRGETSNNGGVPHFAVCKPEANIPAWVAGDMPFKGVLELLNLEFEIFDDDDKEEKSSALAQEAIQLEVCEAEKEVVNGGTIPIFAVSKPDSNVAICIPTEMPLEVVLELVKDNLENIDEKKIKSALSDYEEVQKNLFVKTVNSDMNEELLKNHPHKKVDDLALIACVCVKNDEEGIHSTYVTQELLKDWKKTPEEVIEAAIDNTPNVLSPSIMRLGDMLSAILGPGAEAVSEEAFIPLIVTAGTGCYGASCIFAPGILEDIAKRMGGSSFYLIPSSVHDWFVLPSCIAKTSKTNIVDTISSVNKRLEPDEILSTHAYKARQENGEWKLISA